MAQNRFFGHIHAILGETLLIRPHNTSNVIERASIHDFESILPEVSPKGTAHDGERFCFNVKANRRVLFADWIDVPAVMPNVRANPTPVFSGMTPRRPEFNESQVADDLDKLLSSTSEAGE